MAMTKKDFEKLATALAKGRPPEARPPHISRGELMAMDGQWERDIDHVCEALTMINQNFNKERFVDWINDQGRGRPGK